MRCSQSLRPNLYRDRHMIKLPDMRMTTQHPGIGIVAMGPSLGVRVALKKSRSVANRLPLMLVAHFVGDAGSRQPRQRGKGRPTRAAR
jgi:hypothetical protein